MYYPDYYRLREEFTHSASETAEPARMINVSTKRAAAMMDAAFLHEKGDGESRFTVPNGKFSDAECVLWELFCRAIRAGQELAGEKN